MNSIDSTQIGELQFLTFPDLKDKIQYADLIDPSLGKNFTVSLDAIVETDQISETQYGKSIKVTVMEPEKIIKGLHALGAKLEEHYEGGAQYPIKEDGVCWLKLGKKHADYVIPEGICQGSIVKLSVKFGGYVSNEKIGLFMSFVDMGLPKVVKKKLRTIKKSE